MNMFFVVKCCIKPVGLVKNVVFLINNCLGAMTTWLLSGISGYYPVSGNHFLLGPVVRRVDSAIHRIVIFSNFLKLFIYWDKSKES